MYSALCSYLQMLRVDKEKQYFFVLIQFFRLNIISLTRATLAAIIHIQENFPIDNFWLYLFNLIDMNVGLVYHAQLLRCVLQELNDLKADIFFRYIGLITNSCLRRNKF